MKKFIVLLTLILLLSGCAEDIVYPDNPPEVTTTAQTEAPAIEHPTFIENRALDYGIITRKFERTIEPESLFPQNKSDELKKLTEAGYIKLEEGRSISFKLSTSTSQHYRVEINCYSNGAAVGLYVGSVEYGAYYTSDAGEFQTYALESVYMREGESTLEFKSLRGDAYIDSVFITQMDVTGLRDYGVTGKSVNTGASAKTTVVAEYLADIYGKNTITAQHCTVNTNVEINAIYDATGRYPAIRAGDMMNYSRCYAGADKKDNRELQLSEEWSNYGGLVMLSWTWYSPMPAGGSHYYGMSTSFNIDKAVSDKDIVMDDLEQLEAMNESDLISNECLELVRDIDSMAENLKYLAERDIPVLWRPMKEPSLKWYWWGCGTPESYIYVWRLMFERFHRFHGLDNLIWVWTGENALYYPGDNYVDIIGVDSYNMTDSSNVNRFAGSFGYGAENKKIALTECGYSPNPDILKRDNAMWLFFGLYKGDYLVGDNGLHASAFNIKERLNYIYNHELTIALDELIPFNF